MSLYIKPDEKETVHHEVFFLCPSCFNQSRIDLDIESDTMGIDSDVRMHFIVSCKECGDDMFECDRDMIDSIIALNRANIKTVGCCQGHIGEFYSTAIQDDNYTYIGPWIDIELSDDATKRNAEVIALFDAKTKYNNIRFDITRGGLRLFHRVNTDGIDSSDIDNHQLSTRLRIAIDYFNKFIAKFVEKYNHITDNYTNHMAELINEK